MTNLSTAADRSASTPGCGFHLGHFAKSRARISFGALLVAGAAWLALPAASQAAANDVGVSQTLSAAKSKPGGTVNVTATVTNHGSQSASQVYVELATLKGKILVFGANDPYTTFSSTQGTCTENTERASATTALECSLGTLAPGQSAQIKATIRVNESAVQQTALLPPPGENEYQDSVKSNDIASDPIFLDVPPQVTGSKKVKLKGLPKGCVAGDFTLTASSKAAGTKKMKIKADLGFSTTNGRHLLFSKQANGSKIKMRIPASKAETQIDEGNFPSYSVLIKAKLGGGRVLQTTVHFKRC
jgi:hypothetical protein